METCSEKTFFLWIFKRVNAAVVDMFKFISRSSRKRCEICPVISIKAPPCLGYLSCWLWTDFTPCSSCFIIKFNLVTLVQIWSPGGNYLIYRQNSWEIIVKEFNISKSEGRFKKIYEKYTHFYVYFNIFTVILQIFFFQNSSPWGHPLLGAEKMKTDLKWVNILQKIKVKELLNYLQFNYVIILL